MPVIISEYVEGSGNDQAIELYNTGASIVDLSVFSLEFYFDGSASSGNVIQLSGTLNPGETYIIADNNASFAGNANLTNTGTFFDGNDAIVLKDGSNIVDSIGQIGNNPGSAWETTGTTNSSGNLNTQNATLRRNLDIAQGDSNPNDAFEPGDEWDGFGANTSDGLGEHQHVPESLEPTDEEQLLLQYINAARADPSGHMTELFNTSDPGINNAISFFGTDQATAEAQVAGLSPVAPVAWNTMLAKSAETHNNLLIQYDAQSHNLPDEPGLGARITESGYTWGSVGENVFSFADNPLQSHAGFYIDWGNGPNGIQSPPGHRNTILNENLHDVGLAFETNEIGSNTGPIAVTHHFARDISGNTSKIVGVVIDDTDNDDFYDIGEGKGGVTVSAFDGTNTFTTTTWGSGGYALEVQPNTTYTVTYSGGGIGADQVFNVTTPATRSFVVNFGGQNFTLFTDDNVEQNVEAAPVIASVADIYSDNTLATLITGHQTFAEALATAVANQAIDITDETAVGDVGAQTVSVEGLTIFGDDPFQGDFTLDAAINDFVLKGSTHANATGNALSNLLSGSDGDNLLTGLGGHDDLAGGHGSDTMIGGEGNDLLRGGLGVDSHIGGAGDDTYIIRDGGDTITELEGEGTDTVYVRVDYTVSEHVENIFANAGSTGLEITGNAQDNDIRGLSGNDTLLGMDGNDTFRGKGGTDHYIGGQGDDIYYVSTNSSTVTESSNEGFDRIFTSSDFSLGAGQEIETLRANSGAGLTLEGNEFDNRVNGLSGDDTISGGKGNDVLIGAGGIDTFVFVADWGSDVIRDFADGSELIDVSNAGINSISDLMITQHGNNVRVTHGDDVIILIGEVANNITSDDFIFGLGD